MTIMERISVRIGSSISEQLAYIRKRTSKSVSAAIKTAITRYYQHLKRDEDVPRFSEWNFIACGEAEPSLSNNYKAVIHKTLETKL